MLLNKEGIFCFECNKYYDPYTGVYLHVQHIESITCLKGHLVGNTYDLAWQKLFNQEVEE